MKALRLAFSVAILECASVLLGSQIDPELAALIPPDTIMLTGMRMSELRETPLYKKMLSQQRLSELDDFARKTHFDPRKDVNDMLVASNGVDSVVLAHGNFKVQPLAGLKKSSYKGVTLYSKGEGAYAILDATTAVAGLEVAVRKAIDQKQSGRQAATELLARARSLTGTAQIWFVSSGWGNLPERMSAENGNLSNLGRMFRSIDSATATADLRSGLTASANGWCRTEQDAKTLADAARGMVGLGRLSVPENQPEMLRLFDGIKVEQQKRSILVNVHIPPDLIDRLLQMTDTRPKPQFPKE